MSNLASNVKKLLNSKRMTQAQLSSMSGVDTATISRVVKGKADLVSDSLIKIADAFGVHPADLIADSRANVIAVQLGVHKIPVLDYKDAVTFNEGEALHEVKQDFILTDGEYSNMAFALRVKGDSMMPKFKEGDILIVDPKERPIPGSYVFAVFGMGEATLRQYRDGGINDEGKAVFELHPLNPIYAPMRSDRQSINVIGTVVEQRIQLLPNL